jgi:hypothetical protein
MRIVEFDDDDEEDDEDLMLASDESDSDASDDPGVPSRPPPISPEPYVTSGGAPGLPLTSSRSLSGPTVHTPAPNDTNDDDEDDIAIPAESEPLPPMPNTSSPESVPPPTPVI